MLTQETLKRALDRPFRFYPSVESSNDLAVAWLREGAEAGSVIIADEQRSGRGRQGRTWYTPPGVALAVSMVLKPPVQHVGRMSLVGALAVTDLCEHLNISRIGIKWPNDVQIDGKKVCGILPEAVWDADRLVGVVLGIGVNVRVTFDGDLADKATSLETHTRRALNRTDLVAYLLQRIEQRTALIGSDILFDAWRGRLVTVGQQVSINGINGLAVDVDPDGALLVQTDDGSVRRIIAGDVLLS